MVGLSIVLESGLHNHKGNTTTNKKNHPQVINKATMVKKPSTSTTTPPPPLQPSHPSSRRTFPASYLPAATFLDQCYLCSQKLLPGKDIYMYKGDRAFCSVECRCRQIFMDEEEITAALYNNKRNNCSSATASSSRAHKGARNRANEFAY